MESNEKISIQNAVEAFASIMRSLRDVDQQTFLSFITDYWKPEETNIQPPSHGILYICNTLPVFTFAWLQIYKKNLYFVECCGTKCNPQEKQLNSIKDIITDIKDRVPFNAILPSESIIPPTIGEVCCLIKNYISQLRIIVAI